MDMNLYLEEENLTKKFINKLIQKEDEFLLSQLKFAIPQIKGEITKGKLQWRGIKLIEINEINGTTKWLEQRGKQIGERLQYNYELKIKDII